MLNRWMRTCCCEWTLCTVGSAPLATTVVVDTGRNVSFAGPGATCRYRCVASHRGSRKCARYGSEEVELYAAHERNPRATWTPDRPT